MVWSDARKDELKLIRIRRAEIARMVHPSICKDEYIRLARREAELIDDIERKRTNVFSVF